MNNNITPGLTADIEELIELKKRADALFKMGENYAKDLPFANEEETRRMVEDLLQSIAWLPKPEGEK